MTTPQARVFAGILERESQWQRLAGGALAVAGFYALMLVGALFAMQRPRDVKRKVPEQLVVTLLDLPSMAALHAAEISPFPLKVPVSTPVRSGNLRRDQESKPGPTSTTTPALTAGGAQADAPDGGLPSSLSPMLGGTPGGKDGGTAQAGGNEASVGNEPVGGVAAALPFMDGMTRPSLLSKVEPIYTREARERGVAGLMLVKCVIRIDGRPERCRIVKGIPLMDQAVLSALAQWRFSPVLYQGKPTAVDYLIPIRLALPEGSP